MMFYLHNVFVQKNGAIFNEMSRSEIIAAGKKLFFLTFYETIKNMLTIKRFDIT
jgi:hypothetical protein